MREIMSLPRRMKTNPGVPELQIVDLGDSLVGRTETKVALQQRLLWEWTPNITFVDELT